MKEAMTASCRDGECGNCSGGRYFPQAGAPGDLGFEECPCDCHFAGEVEPERPEINGWDRYYSTHPDIDHDYSMDNGGDL